MVSPVELSKFNKELKGMIEYLRANEHIKTKVQLLKDSDYTVSWFYKKAERMRMNPSTQDLIKKIDDILEARLIEHGLTKANYGFVIFLLKNHYGYQDKREIETDHTYTFKVTRGDLRSLKTKKVKNTSSTTKA